MKRPMFAFGQLMLPIVGIVAIGLLIVGVKLFFLPTSSDGGPDHSPGTQQQTTAGSGQDVTATPAVTMEEESQGPSQSGGDDAGAPANGQTEHDTDGGDDIVAVPVGDEPDAGAGGGTGGSTGDQGAADATQEDQGSTPQNGTWGVQIGAFKTNEQAKNVAREARSEGFSTRIMSAVVNGTQYYRVRVVAGDSREESRQIETRLQELGYPTLIVRLQ
ncbi:MAG: SPOR domain-containing protein [Synergistales bacterium]|nr:SPOR domain-containing protein [Synergistales bacterium]